MGIKPTMPHITMIVVTCLSVVALSLFVQNSSAGLRKAGQKKPLANPIRNWTGIVIHHSGSNYDNLEKIDAYHRSKGWDMCGYHFVIERNGIVKEGRPLNKTGAHAKTGKSYSRNKTHIGICLCGTDNFSAEQIKALYNSCKRLAQNFPIASIERHHEECPGPGVNIELLREKILGR
ncbi:N-acetylmuramoyl-L-alanine amidase [bacterium]|nr:MAG: N-acetylmuramoyl-L-alanine amidase [bacterium]